jgi:hypothetical protein
MKSKTKILILSLLLLFIFVNFGQAALVTCGNNARNAAQAKSDACQLSDLFYGIVTVVNFLIGSATLLTIGYILFGGLKMVWARGNEETIRDAKSTIFHAIEGLIIVLLAYLIVNFTLSVLTGGSYSIGNAGNILNFK